MTAHASVDDCRTAVRLSHNCRIQTLAMIATRRLENCMLVVEGLTCRFGTKAAVDNASFSIAPGGFVGVIGRSGAGKSTFAANDQPGWPARRADQCSDGTARRNAVMAIADAAVARGGQGAGDVGAGAIRY